MQLTRSVVVAITATIAASTAVARADTSFVSKLQVYADSDHTTVVSPLVQASADVTSDTSVSLGYVADVVTSASVDVVSQASPITIHDTRHQVSSSLGHVFGPLSVRASYAYSRENDYLSHTLGLGVQTDLFDKTTTLALGYGLGLNTVGRANDRNFERGLTVNTLSASWTQIVSPRLLTQLTYELQNASGFQSSVYRFVPIRANADAAPDGWVMETDPDARWRHALVLGANYAVGDTGSVQGDYRIYHDTWGITSHTLGARYFFDLTPALSVRLRNRLYTQSAASFYESSYAKVATYMTFDRELSPLWSETLGAKLAYRVTPQLEAELKCDLFYYQYADFAPLASRTGTNVGVGLSLTY
ncbi:MAG: DUF3570 domain-containing protein [Proteobacteria bacterium]|nr:DUF3570 domain-containing protein [Pseudomonadota bacterium]